MRLRIVMCLVVFVVLYLFAHPCHADTAGATTMEELQILVQQLQQEMAALKNEVSTLRKSVPEWNGHITMPSIPSSQEPIPSWIKGTNFGGDIRLRFQNEFRNRELADRHRGRVRLRYGFTKQVSNELRAGFRIVTGGENVLDYYDDLGAETGGGGFNKLEPFIDQLYLQYNPEWLEGATIWGGKFHPNWRHRSVLLDPKFTGVDGIGESYELRLSDYLDADMNFAQLITTEGGTTSFDADSELYVFDLGVKGTCEPVTWGLRGTAYIFDGWGETGGSGLSTGNSSSLSNPRVFVGSADIGFDLFGIPSTAFALGALNTGDVRATSDVQDQDKGFAVGLAINKLQKQGDWAFGYTYGYLEQNVFPGELVNVDIGVNNQSHVFALQYRLFNSTDLELDLIIPRLLSGDRDSEKLVTKSQITTRF